MPAGVVYRRPPTGTGDFFQTNQALLEAARGTPMHPDRILALAARLDRDAEIVRNAIAAALEEDEAHVAALIAMPAGSRQQPSGAR